MSRFPSSDKPEESKSLPKGTSIGGTYGCQTCDEIVVGAVHFRDTQEIYWECPEGHLSKIPFRM